MENFSLDNKNLSIEIRRNLPWVKYASVKHAADRSKAEAIPRDEVSHRIETAAREALQNLSAAKLPDFPGPYRFALTFQDEDQARNATLPPGAELLADRVSVQIRSNDFEEGYRQSLRLIGLAGAIARTNAVQAVLSAQPNAAALRVGVTDWLYDRFLGRLPVTLPQAAAGAPANRGPRARVTWHMARGTFL